MPTLHLADKSITLHWDAFIHRLLDVPDPDNTSTTKLADAKDLLHRLLSAEFSGQYVLDLTDETFQLAYEVLNERPNENPLIEMARLEIDDEGWEDIETRCLRLSPTCDPSVAEVFL